MTERGSVLRYLPNIISVGRIASTPVLVILALTGREDAFKWLLLAALLSDIADGLVARGFSLSSELGARLDTWGDTLLWIASVTGIWKLKPDFVADYWAYFVAIFGLWLLFQALALLRYGKLAGFHTHISRVTAYALGIFMMVLFLWGVQPWLLYVALVLHIFSIVEQAVLVAMLPERRSNVGGVYWVLQERRANTP